MHESNHPCRATLSHVDLRKNKPFQIRPADVYADRSLLIDVFSRCLPRITDSATFDWLYLGNPHGPPHVWLATDGDHVIGATAAFPRRFLIGGKIVSAWVLGDFCVISERRSLGPALALQRACLAAAERDGGPRLIYDFPSATMMAIYQRLQLPESTHMVRFVRLLRSDVAVRSLVKSPALARSVSAPLNIALDIKARLSRAARSVDIALHEGLCDEEFSRLAHRASSRLAACVDRSATYLNWRYRKNPLWQCEILTARRGRELSAYAVFVDGAHDGLLVDLFGEDLMALGALLEGLADVLRRRGRRSISAPLIAAHPWTGILRTHGFRARDSQPVIIMRRPGWLGSPVGADASQLSLSHGDRDS